MVIHLGRYVHFADSSWLNREQTSAGQRWRCMPFFTFPLVGIRERERGRYTSYLSFAYRHCSRHTDKQCPAIRSPFQNIVALSATGCLVTRHGARCTILSHFCRLIFARMPSQLSRNEKSSITDFTPLRTFQRNVSEIFSFPLSFFNFFSLSSLAKKNSKINRRSSSKHERRRGKRFETTGFERRRERRTGIGRRFEQIVE